jgi:hypothetical protein
LVESSLPQTPIGCGCLHTGHTHSASPGASSSNSTDACEEQLEHTTVSEIIEAALWFVLTVNVFVHTCNASVS